ncbi:MAG: adenylosuccinate lyase [Clostridium sp.]|nr:adenylosuccinate lyase [Clostridium sp.]
MIERYSLKEMKELWELKSKFSYYLKVELAVCEAYNEQGKIPDEDLRKIKEKAAFSISRIDEIEKEVGHDVIAFLTNVNENVGESSRYIHMGMTSSDVIDTAFALQIQKASEIIEKDLDNVIETIRNKAIEHKETVCIGRSHGIHAEPMTFGVKLCSWLDLFERAKKRFIIAKEEIRVGQISGPVGTYSNISPEIEQITCKKLGLRPAKISTQVIARDYHANYMQTLALIASAIEQCAIEIRHLQRTEVLEVEEAFKKGQKGSSAMPHKKNPISSENLSGLARVVKSNAIASLENIPLWHERDISHSSVERITFPDSTILIDYMLNRFNRLVEGLVVHKINMLKNSCLYGGIVYSQRVLLALTEKGLSREKAYELVQSNALRAFNNPEGNFKQNLLNNKEICNILTKEEIENCFNSSYYLRNIHKIYERFGI